MNIDPPSSSVIREAVSRALGEDRGPCDITSFSLISEGVMATARLFVKEVGVLSGGIVAEQVFYEVNPRITVEICTPDGATISKGQDILRIEGPARDLLTAERTALNFIQHLSGIATETARYVSAAAGTKTKILDTRKTTPGLRLLEKYAVRCGGGVNHRIGLYDEFMAKDNHVEMMHGQGGLSEAVKRMRTFDPQAKLTFEADTLEQVRELVALGVDQILLDNMTNAQMAEAVLLAQGRCKLEASGNMALERVAAVSAVGVDFISVGALTHSVRALDFSLEITPKI